MKIFIITLICIIGNIALIIYNGKHIGEVPYIYKFGMIFNILLFILILIELFKLSKGLWFYKKQSIVELQNSANIK